MECICSRHKFSAEWSKSRLPKTWFLVGREKLLSQTLSYLARHYCDINREISCRERDIYCHCTSTAVQHRNTVQENTITRMCCVWTVHNVNGFNSSLTLVVGLFFFHTTNKLLQSLTGTGTRPLAWLFSLNQNVIDRFHSSPNKPN